jgi:hypothetical protein
VNNLIYNSTYYSIKTKGHKDIIGNYMKDGPYCCSTTAEIQTWTGADGTSVNPDLYIAGNAANTNGYNPNADQWSGGLTGMTPSGDNSDTVTSPLSTAYRRTTPLAPVGAPITIDSATDVASANGVLLPAYPNSQGKPGVGASAKLNDTACDGSWVSNRDSADANFVAQFNNNTGHSGNITSPGTAPILAAGAACASSLHDGIADQWKIKHGLSTTDTTLYRTTAPNGYTYLENYLNGTDPNVTASMSSATSFWAALSSKRRAGGGLNIGTALRFEGDRTIQRREILLSPSTTFGDKQPMRHPQAKVNAWGDRHTNLPLRDDLRPGTDSLHKTLRLDSPG